MSLKIFGAGAFRAAIERGIELAEHAEALIRADPAWELVTPARLGVVTFRAAVPGATAAELDALHARLPAAALADGFAFPSTTRVGGRTALRLCTVNPRATSGDVERTLAALADDGFDRSSPSTGAPTHD